MEPEVAKSNILKKAIIVGLMLVIGALHFVTGDEYRGPFPVFVNGYLIDILLPFGLVFLLSLFESKVLRHWAVRGGLVFAFGVFVEMMQLAGKPFLGSTFDPLDIVMYALGVGLALVMDQVVLPHIPGLGWVE